MVFKNAVIFIFFFLLNSVEILSFSLPIYSTKSLSNCTTIQEILDYFKNNIRYSFIKIGEPSNRLPIIFTSHDSFSIINKNDYPIHSDYDLNYSKSIKIIQEELNLRYIYIKDYISLDEKDAKIEMNFIYNNKTGATGNNFGFIGIQNIEPEDKKIYSSYNFFIQLKNSNTINKALIYFNFSENNNESIVIGEEPYEINPFLYSEQNKQKLEVDYILDNEIKQHDRGKYRWNLNISKVFYFKKLPIQSNIDPYVEVSRKNTRKVDFFQALLTPEETLIRGPFEYIQQIENDYFYDLFKENKCSKINFDRKYYIVCKKENKYLLEKTFPSLYFYSSKLNYMFNLNYNDLFIEKGEYLIFGIYFNYFETPVFTGAFLSEWYFGKIFLKKYCFSFDFQNGEIAFYKENIIKKKNNKKEVKEKTEKKITMRFYQLGLIFIVLGIAVIAFIYDRASRRKYRIENRLIDYKLNV